MTRGAGAPPRRAGAASRGAGIPPAAPPASGRRTSRRRGGGVTAGEDAAPPSAYGNDLAYIHHHGFSGFAEAAAPWVIALLREHRVQRVVEVGCGSGVLARELTGAGFEVTGFDASPSMIALARQTAPAARFEVAPFANAELPPCDALIGMGEVLNHGTLEDVRALLARTDARVLLFDVAEEETARDERRLGGDDWSVILIREGKTRRVLTFRRVEGETRRDEEVHALELFDRRALTALLREHGFGVAVRRSYGRRRVPVGHAVYVCVRPGRRAGPRTGRAR